MSILGIITVVSKITTIANTAKSIIELVDKALTNEDEKEKNLSKIETLCQKALENPPQTRILSTEEENAIREYVKTNNVEHVPAMICKLALENNFTAVEMIVSKLKRN